jgi:small-conductance mechanosensitive channel
MNDWIAAAIALAAGLIGASFVGRIVQNVLSQPRRPKALRSAAGPVSSLAFSAVLVAGLMTALGFVNRQALDDIPNDLVDFLPRLLSAGIVLILANVAAQLVSAAMEGTVARMGSAGRNLPTIVRAVILGFGAVLAAAQLGVDTTVINITIAAILFGAALSVALLSGLGGRAVSAEVAAGRAVRRMLNPGDTVHLDGVDGTVVSVGSVAVEIATGDGTAMVPNSRFVGEGFAVTRRSPSPSDPAAGSS